MTLTAVRPSSRPKGSPTRSTTKRLAEFYRQCPDEELCLADIVVKFECTMRAAVDAVTTLKQQGLIESVHVVRLKSKGRMK